MCRAQRSNIWGNTAGDTTVEQAAAEDPVVSDTVVVEIWGWERAVTFVVTVNLDKWWDRIWYAA